jgi:hypothetical protein
MTTSYGSSRGGADAPKETVYWILPPAATQRHGITDKPGAWPSGTKVTALCGDRVKIPWPTPMHSTPKSKSITRRCAGCVAEYERRGCPSTVWDF